MKSPQFLRVWTGILVIGVALCAAGQPSSTVLEAMHTELERSMFKLKAQPVPPYFLSYEIVDTHSFFITSTFGKLTSSSENHHRQLGIDLRVGDYAMDNMREIRGGMTGFPIQNFPGTTIPLDNDPDAIRAALWYRTDDRYKRAAEQYAKVKTNTQVEVAPEDKSDDFSHEEAEQYSEPQVDIKVDRRAWEDKLRRYTGQVLEHLRGPGDLDSKRGDKLVRQLRRLPDSNFAAGLAPVSDRLQQSRRWHGTASLRIVPGIQRERPSR